MTVLLLLAVVVSGLGTLFLLHQSTAPVTAPTSVVGHAFFVSSEQLNGNINSQGINDELQVDLSGIPAPDAGQSYCAWLLPDKVQTEAAPIFLGQLNVDHGQIHFLYTGGQHHIDLLEVTSRFLISEEDSAFIPTLPSLDTNKWRYYAELTQQANPDDQSHFSMLDHFRHLLVEAPELKALGLRGGLADALLQSTQNVLTLANSARDAWQTKDYTTTRNQIIRMIDLLDGRKLARINLPPTMVLLTDPQQYDQIPLLGEDMQHLQGAQAHRAQIPPILMEYHQAMSI